jgi:response regulator NasT
MESKRILIADDDGLFRRDLRETLARLGHVVVGEAPDGLQALRLARRLQPDLVILDVRMPRLDGYQVAEAIARSDGTPVLLLTGHAESVRPDPAPAAHICGCLGKPFVEAELARAIDAAVRQSHRAAELKQEVRAMRADPPLRALIRRAKSILMRRHGVSEPEAFARLQNDSFRTGRSLREIAAALCHGRRAAAPRPPQEREGSPPSPDGKGIHDARR